MQKTLAVIMSIIMIVAMVPFAFAAEECTEHTYSEWETVTEATESERGTVVRRCENCDSEQTGTIPATEAKEIALSGNNPIYIY